MTLVRVLVVSLFLSGGSAWAQAPTLELKRVLLSLGGVGYFEFEARVEGNAELTLPVRLDQVDDVLKSVVVFDDRGAVGQITLPGRDPLSQTFRDLPFGQDALGSLDQLLNALSGAEVTVSGPRQLSGRVLAVVPETVRLPNNGGEMTRHRVTLVAADGIRQFVLQDAESVRFADPALQGQVDRALAAVARHRLQEQRILTVSAQGAGQRRLRVGYVVGTPLWKTSYRMSVPDAGAEGLGLLQGWAVVENLSGHDWRQVELTLASGNPVTFRQQLYEAYFVNRPEVPVDVLARIAPPADAGALDEAAKTRTRAVQAQAAPPAPAPMASAPAGAAGRREDFAALERAVPPPPPAQAAITTGEAQEASTQVLFNAAEPVTVRSGETLMLPIVNRRIPVERLALYQPGVHPTHPLAALRLTNDSGVGLPPGLATLYEQSAAGAAHVGDARLGLTPAGERRMLSFALDYKLQVERETRHRQMVTQARIARGALTVSRREEESTLYRIRQPAEDRRTVVIEHPRPAGWELVTPQPATVELASGVYRVRVAPAAGTSTSEVVLQRPLQNVIQLTGQTRRNLLAYAQTAELGEPVRRALEQLAGLMAEVERLEAQIRDLSQESERLAKDQDRLRQNLGSVPGSSDLAKRYLEQMKAQEDRFDQLRRADDEARRRLTQARDAAADFIAKLEV